MAFRVLVCDPVHPEALSWLESQPDVEVIRRPGLPRKKLLEEIGDVDALIVRSRTRIGPEELSLSPRLRVIGRAGMGLDNIDLEAARRKGVRVVNTPGASADAVAELTLGLLIALARDLSHALASREKPERYGWELSGKTLGIVGLGRIGSRVARLALAFGMRVLAHDTDPALEPQEGVERRSLEALLSESDVVSLHVPLTEETRHLIGEATLAQLRRGAALVNTARAQVVDEAAVLKALEDGRLSGYAADFPGSPRLHDHPRTLLTPHIGAQTEEAQRRAGLEVARRVVSALRRKSSSRTVFG